MESWWGDEGSTGALQSSTTAGISQHSLAAAQAWKLFEIMDEDDNGEINADEFVSLEAWVCAGSLTAC